MTNAPGRHFARDPAGMARQGAIDKNYLNVEATALEFGDLVEDGLDALGGSIEHIAESAGLGDFAASGRIPPGFGRKVQDSTRIGAGARSGPGPATILRDANVQ